MLRSITYTLLITCVLFLFSCKMKYTQVSYDTHNYSVSDSLNGLDSGVVQMIQPYKNILENDMNRVISYSENEMEKDKPESLLTNFLADLLLAQGAEAATENGLDSAPSVSFYNYGGIRTFLPKGDITVGKIYELMPFENEMVYLLLKGEQIQEFLDVTAEKGGDSVGGARFVISNGKAKNVEIGGEPINLQKNYWMVTNDYVATGGDDMAMFGKNLKFINSGKKIRDVIISFMEERQKEGENISAKLDGRIRYE